MSKDRFDRLDDDLFEKAPAPAVAPSGTRFSREDVIEAARTQAERLRAMGVTFSAETVARLEAEQHGRIIIDSLSEYSEPHTVIEPGEEETELPADPPAWLFHVCTEPMDSALGERPWVVFTPIAYWRTHHAQIDATLDGEPISEQIPAYLEEVADSTFVVLLNGPNLDMVRDDLIARGFQEDPAFSAWVDPEHPEHHAAIDLHRATREAILASHERDDYEVPRARAAIADARNETDRIIETLEARRADTRTPEERAAVTEALEQEAELNRRRYDHLGEKEVIANWYFTVTQSDGHLVVVFCHRYWWDAYQTVPNVPVLRYLNDWLPPWVHAEMQSRCGAFWIDPDISTSEGVRTIGELERLGFRLLPLLGPAAGFPV